MKLFKFPVVTGDALVASNSIWADMSTLQDITVGTTTCVLSGTGWVITLTTDGDDTAESLLNANKLADYFVPILLEYNGNAVHRGQSQSVYDVWSGLDIPGIHAATGIVCTTTPNTALVSVVLS